MRYEVYRDMNLQWRWRLRAANQRILANSGEGYHKKQDCLDAIALVKASSTAPILEIQS